MIVTPFERHVAFEGCFNFRDLGGYRTTNSRTVRWRRLFRSDTLCQMTPRDAERAYQEIGIATVIDLRSPAEVERYGLGLLIAGATTYHHLPLMNDVQLMDDVQPRAGKIEKYTLSSLLELYMKMLAEASPSITAALKYLADPSTYPVVFHCAAGKDRTGVMAAVILSVIGVEDDEIVRDYALTTAYIEPIIERMRSVPEYERLVQSLPAEAFHATPDTMASFLERVRRDYGSMRAYVQAQGVDEEVLNRLEEELLA